MSGFEPECPLPGDGGGRILLAHGGGGRLMQALLREQVLPALNGLSPGQLHDAAVLQAGSQRLAFTSDSYVVRPRAFPGGDIGSLAVNGTINDLAVSGARPLWLSASLIIEEGLARAELAQVLGSMRAAADAAGVAIVTGDTKVVERGAADGLYINTAGIGLLAPDVDIHPARIGAGDAVLVSGDLGRHGLAVLACREDLGLLPPPASDCAALSGLVQHLLDGGLRPHCLRDITRGGLTAVLHELAQAARVGIELEEARIPVSEAVGSACEVLGLDPLQLACEGRLVAVVPAAQAEATLARLASHRLGAGARHIGWTRAGSWHEVVLNTRSGARRVLDLPAGELLPRIC